MPPLLLLRTKACPVWVATIQCLSVATLVVLQSAGPLILALPILATQNAANPIAVIRNVVTRSVVTRNVVIHGAVPSVALLNEATLSLVQIAVTRYAVIHDVVPNVESLSAESPSAAIQFEVLVDFRVALIVVPISVLTSVQCAARNVVEIPDCHGHDAPRVDSRVVAHVAVP